MSKKKVTECNGCKVSITKTQNSLRCNGECRGWFHKKCTKLNDADYGLFEDKKSGQKWICPGCQRSSSSESDGSQDDSEVDERDDNKLHEVNLSKRKSSVALKKEDKDILSKSNPTNKEILQFLMRKFSELEVSVKFNSDIMDDLQKTLMTLSKENAAMRREQKALKTRVEHLEEKLGHLDRIAEKDEVEQKMKNVIIFGLTGGDTAREDVKKIFRKLDVEVEDAGYTVQSLQSKGERRPVLVKLRERSVRDKLLEVKKNKKSVRCSVE